MRIPTQVVATIAAPPDTPMFMPNDVTLDAADRVYVADGVNSRVTVFNPDGSFIGAIVSADNIRLSRPQGLYVDAQGRLWITDTKLHRAFAVATKGPSFPEQAPLLINLQLPTVQHGKTIEPADPTDIVVSPDGQVVYITDNDRGRLIVHDLTTNETRVIGHPGRGLGEFEWPFQLTLGPDGYLYVLEVIAARIQRINTNGRPAGRISGWGIEAGDLYRPKGIAVAADGTLYVSDSTLRCVQVFRTDGTFLGVLTDPIGNPLRFDHPMGMALDSHNRLYVVEMTANRVAIIAPGKVRPAEAAIGGPETQPAGGPNR